MSYDILFLGRLFPREYEAEIKSKMKTGMQDAANALQWNIIDGLEANNCGKIKIVNYLPVDSYPRGYHDKKIPQYVFQHTDKYVANDINVACNNMQIIKQFVNLSPLKSEVKRWVKDGSSGTKVLMCYTALGMFLKLAQYVKKIDPSIKTCCIIADIPEFATASDLHGLRRIYNTYNAKKCASLYRYIDRFVLLTEQMAEKLKIRAPFVVMEGIAPDENVETDDSYTRKYKGSKYVFYSGTLNYKFGIGVLLEAFSLLKDDDVKLLICGFGEAEVAINNAKDDRIVFLGRLDRSAVLSLQRSATVLVNPRQNNEEFTKYSFPSKTMEYLAAGVPVVAYKLDGIPDEYDAFLQFVSGNSPQELANCLQNLLALSAEERYRIGNKGKEFVLNKKNCVVQAKKILDFI